MTFKRLVPETVEGTSLDVRLFHILHELGVTEIHLGEHALYQLQKRLQALYVPSTPITDPARLVEIDAGWAGDLCGVRFYRDLSE